MLFCFTDRLTVPMTLWPIRFYLPWWVFCHNFKQYDQCSNNASCAGPMPISWILTWILDWHQEKSVINKKAWFLTILRSVDDLESKRQVRWSEDFGNNLVNWDRNVIYEYISMGQHFKQQSVITNCRSTEQLLNYRSELLAAHMFCRDLCSANTSDGFGLYIA